MTEKSVYTIALMSDIHCGDQRFDGKLLDTVIDEVNETNPDLTVIAGDLTANGYREQFSEAKEYIDKINCAQKIVIAGNHDHRNVGWVHFEDILGPRFVSKKFDFKLRCHGVYQENIKILAADSNKPDINDGEIGRRHYFWIRDNFNNDNDLKIFVLHHHLVSVPGAGRERNIVWDAGDVLEVLRNSGTDLVLCGHKHVPYIWMVHRMIIVNSGTAGTHRTRGYAKPAYTYARIYHDHFNISINVPGEGVEREEQFERSRIPSPVVR